MVEKYLGAVIQKYKTGKTTEHSFRGDLQDFVERTVIGVQAINEPRRQKCGAPDYIIQKKNIPIGYIEAKDIDKSLDTIDKTEQLDRYKASLDNLILTNYLEFWFYKNSEHVDTIKVAELSNGKIKTYDKEYQRLINAIRNFCDYQGQTIKSPKQLANLMAQKAVMIRDVIINALELDSESSLVSQRNAFKQILLHDLTNHTFADMYAQTIAYGLFVARLNDTTLEDFSRQEARELISKNNPFLRQLFDYISGANLDDSLVWIVDDLVEIFRAVDLNKLLRNYGRTTQMSDPFLHFYETFLESYDKVNKEKRGVYYTPQPVVRFIVSAVDRILKNEFKLSHGLADDSTIRHTRTLYYESKKVRGKVVDMPVTTEEDIYKVQILDPATGTGTFLAETIRKIYSYFVNQQGIWSQYVDKALIPRLNGFEIMMTPYVMCHLKLDLLLRDTGYKTTSQTNRFNVYLTNTLEQDEVTKYPLFDWLSDEARHANTVKNDKPIMVVIGNPPYSGESANGSLFNDNLDVYKKEPTGEKLQEKNPKWLNDDYVKFIRLSQEFIDKNKEGVLAFINNHAYLDNPTFRGMRYSLLKSFDKIYIIDLHGNAKRKETVKDGSKDENVFDIQQGVSINIFVKTGIKQHNELAKVYHTDLLGLRELKFDYMNNHEIDTIEFTELQPVEPYYFFVPKNFNAQSDYDNGFKIEKLFNLNSVGVVTARDNLCIKENKESIRNTIHNFSGMTVEEARQHYSLGKDARDWKIELAQKDLVSSNLADNNIVQIAYRPFDYKWTYYTGKSKGFHCMPRGEVMKHLLSQNNVALACCKHIKAFDTYQHCYISNNIIESCLVSNKTSEITYTFPLYLVNDDSEQKSFFDVNRKPNLNMNIVKSLETALGLSFTPEKENAEGTFAPIDILDYIYGVLHSNKYRTKYKEFLKIDFPRIPYPASADYFFKIAKLGKELREIHLMEAPEVKEYITSYGVSGDNEVIKPEYKDNKVYINRTQYFDNVPEVAWNFYIGGYQPAQKWLKDRKGRILSYDEILHYQKIIKALVLTNDIMQEIDEIINI
ncbi:MAG: DNA methyltransferase [Cyanobacteria bacterium SIG32]|nr:DNA methyltransferase [Cyanobacteria bacterium SIG32]